MKHWNPEQELALTWEPQARVAPVVPADEVIPARRRLVAWSLAGVVSLGLWAIIYQGVRGLLELGAHFF